MKRTNNFLVAIIVLLTIIIFALIILLILSLTTIKEKPYEKEEPVQEIVNGNIMKFLDKTISLSGDPYYNILDSMDKTDEEMFNMIIGYLFANDMYTKSNDEFIFKQSDVNDIAKKYMMKDNFNYIPQNPLFRYDESSKTYISKLEFDVLGLKAYILKSVDIYEKTETTASVILEIEGSYDITNERINKKYNIVVQTKKNDYKIISINKIR